MIAPVTKGYKLQWKRTGGSAKPSDPWIELVDDRDAKQCAADVREFLRTKRKTTNWKLVVQVVAPVKSGGEKRGHEDDSSAESIGPSKKKKKVRTFTVIIPGCTGLMFTANQKESGKYDRPPSPVYRTGEYTRERGCGARCAYC
jgi:hypothetical protein